MDTPKIVIEMIPVKAIIAMFLPFFAPKLFLTLASTAFVFFANGRKSAAMAITIASLFILFIMTLTVAL